MACGSSDWHLTGFMVTPFLFPWLLPKCGSIFSFFTSPPGEVKLRSVPSLLGSTAQWLDGPWELGGRSFEEQLGLELVIPFPRLAKSGDGDEMQRNSLLASPQLLRARASIMGTKAILLSLWREV